MSVCHPATFTLQPGSIGVSSILIILKDRNMIAAKENSLRDFLIALNLIEPFSNIFRILFVGSELAYAANGWPNYKYFSPSG